MGAGSRAGAAVGAARVLCHAVPHRAPTTRTCTLSPSPAGRGHRGCRQGWQRCHPRLLGTVSGIGWDHPVAARCPPTPPVAPSSALPGGSGLPDPPLSLHPVHRGVLGVCGGPLLPAPSTPTPAAPPCVHTVMFGGLVMGGCAWRGLWFCLGVTGGGEGTWVSLCTGCSGLPHTLCLALGVWGGVSPLLGAQQSGTSLALPALTHSVDEITQLGALSPTRGVTPSTSDPPVGMLGSPCCPPGPPSPPRPAVVPRISSATPVGTLEGSSSPPDPICLCPASQTPQLGGG